MSLVVGCSFAAYGALRKWVAADAASGLLVETMLLAPIALAWMVWLGAQGQAEFGSGSGRIDSLLVLGGVVTGTPLLLYVAAAKRLPLATVGLIFYLTPTLQFLLGAFAYGEPVGAGRLLTFVLIWVGLLVYTIEGRMNLRRMAAVEVT